LMRSASSPSMPRNMKSGTEPILDSRGDGSKRPGVPA
jgi:hypothetical protein